MPSKVETFIGFSVKAGKCKLGVNSVETLKRAKLLIVCETASENTFKVAVSLSKKLGAPLIKTVSKKLEDAVHKENCKLMAVTDKALADAIYNNLDGNFIEYHEEVK